MYLPINVHATHCTGDELKLLDCDYEVYPYYYCRHSLDVGLTCKLSLWHCEEEHYNKIKALQVIMLAGTEMQG